MSALSWLLRAVTDWLDDRARVRSQALNSVRAKLDTIDRKVEEIRMRPSANAKTYESQYPSEANGYKRTVEVKG
jgi:hypothetical protein